MSTGYLHEAYARSFAALGTLLRLPRSGGWLLVRDIPGAPGRQDATGLYPLMCCQDWAGLPADLAEVGADVVCVTAVPDPMGTHTPELLRRSFPDLLRSYKQHQLLDVSRPYEQTVSKHHRYYARRALRTVAVEWVADPPGLLDEWAVLYAGLRERHGIDGIQAFSRETFAGQLATPGLQMAVAREEDEIVAAHLWFADGEVAYSHLAAATERGYALSAQYALYGQAVRHFAGQVRWLELGGAPDGPAGSGLDGFKRGWASDRRDCWLAGRTNDHAAYAALSQNVGPSDWFPAYRRPKRAADPATGATR